MISNGPHTVNHAVCHDYKPDLPFAEVISFFTQHAWRFLLILVHLQIQTSCIFFQKLPGAASSAVTETSTVVRFFQDPPHPPFSQ